MTPEDLLFINPDTKIYNSQTDLVESIISLPNSNFSNAKPESLKSLLSKTIRGERKLSVKLYDAIIHTIASNSNIDQNKIEIVRNRLKPVFDEAFNHYAILKKFQEEHKISTKLFIDLEIKSKKIELNCITSNLNWTVEHIEGIINSAKNNFSTYKYLVFDFQGGRNANILEKRVKEEGLVDKIQVRRAYKKLEFFKKNTQNCIDTSSILFPLFEDLVIYKNIPNKLKQIFNIKNSEIIVRGSANYEEDYDRLYDDFILDEGYRVNGIIDWFDTIWESCE